MRRFVAAGRLVAPLLESIDQHLSARFGLVPWHPMKCTVKTTNDPILYLTLNEAINFHWSAWRCHDWLGRRPVTINWCQREFCRRVRRGRQVPAVPRLVPRVRRRRRRGQLHALSRRRLARRRGSVPRRLSGRHLRRRRRVAGVSGPVSTLRRGLRRLPKLGPLHRVRPWTPPAGRTLSHRL